MSEKERNLEPFIPITHYTYFCALSIVNFHTHRAESWYYQSFFIPQLMHKWIVLKTILKFTEKLTLKQLRNASVQSPSSGGALFELAKVTVVKNNQLKYIGVV
jgi:hypothetical protein